MCIKPKKRNRRGNVIAEMPVVIYLLIVGLLIPCIALATYGYRAVMVYMCVRDSAYQASKSTSFTNAQANALKTWTTDSQAWTGVTGTIQTFIVTEPGNNAQLTKLGAAYDPAKTYMIRVAANCTLIPLWGSNGTWLGMSIPGFTAPLPITLNYSYYAENPQGLDK